jgi:lipid A ethanolaminephosphotransferase
MNIPKMPGYTISHARFSVFYCVISYALFNFINYSRFAKWFQLKDGTDYVGLLAFFAIGLLLFVFVFLLLAHRPTTKLFAILFVVLGASAAYFVNKYDVAIDRTMLMNAIHTDPSEVHSLLSWQMMPFVLLLMVVPIVIILQLKLTFEKNYFIASLKLILIALALSVALAYSCFQNISRAANVSNKQIVHTLVPINYLQSFGSIVQNELGPYFSKHKKKIIVSGQVTEQKNLLVVLAVGESARQDNFSLYGYKRRDTNPMLSKVSGLHALNGKARLGSTLYALPEILTKDDVALPALTAKIGIDTACYVNFTLYDNCSAPGEVAVTNCGHGGNCYDEDVIPLFEKRLKSYVSGYSFTVLHLGGGSHGPSYQERIPAEYTEFKPVCLDADVVNKCSVEQLYNSYDNTLLYTDHVLASIIQKLDQSTLPYVFIYLSDHGESLLEEGRIFHGMPPGMKLPPEQARIPLLIKSSVPIDIQPRKEYVQTDVFDSILQLLSVKSEIHDETRAFITHANGSKATASPAPH